MTKEQHEKEVEKLQGIEGELIQLIAESDNEELQNKFLDWQEQRNVCNDGYLEFIESLIQEKEQ